MAALVTRAARERCCLLCYEADPHECYRWFVVERAIVLSGGALTTVPPAVTERSSVGSVVQADGTAGHGFVLTNFRVCNAFISPLAFLPPVRFCNFRCFLRHVFPCFTSPVYYYTR